MENAIPSKKIIVLLPLLLLLLLVSVFVWNAREIMFEKVIVDVVKARLAESESEVTVKNDGEVSFQAAGWIEAEPYPIRVTALVSGIVKKIHVIAGHKVKEGDILAELISEDLILEKNILESQIMELQAQITTKNNILKSKLLENNKVISEIATAKVILEKLEFQANSLNLSGFAAASLDKELARFAIREQELKIQELYSQEQIFKNDVEVIKASIVEINKQIATQKIQMDKIKLAINRLTIYAPSAGIIQKLYVREGRKQMLDSDSEFSTTVAEIYDPKYLQVRVDVPLRDIAKVFVGQSVFISLEACKQDLLGEVIVLGGEADYQKNTLEVKVRILDPMDILRPEMLAQVKFLESPQQTTKTFLQAVFIRRDCIKNDLENAYVWVVLPDSTIRKKDIEYFGQDDWVIVTHGIDAGERIVYINEGDLINGKKAEIRRLHE